MAVTRVATPSPRLHARLLLFARSSPVENSFFAAIYRTFDRVRESGRGSVSTFTFVFTPFRSIVARRELVFGRYLQGKRPRTRIGSQSLCPVYIRVSCFLLHLHASIRAIFVVIYTTFSVYVRASPGLRGTHFCRIPLVRAGIPGITPPTAPSPCWSCCYPSSRSSGIERSPCWWCCPRLSKLSVRCPFLVLVVLPTQFFILCALPTHSPLAVLVVLLTLLRSSPSPSVPGAGRAVCSWGNPSCDAWGLGTRMPSAVFCRYLQRFPAARKRLAVPCGKALSGAPQRAVSCGNLARGVYATSDRQVAVLHHKRSILGGQRVPLGPSEHRHQHRERVSTCLCAVIAPGLVFAGSPLVVLVVLLTTLGSPAHRAGRAVDLAPIGGPFSLSWSLSFLDSLHRRPFPGRFLY